MIKTKLLMSAAVLASAALLAPRAHANPVQVGYSINGGATVVTLNTGDGTAGVFGASVAGITLSISATGTPPDSSPNFSSNTLDITANAPGAITIYATETGLHAVVPNFNVSFSLNSGSTTSVTESFYASSSNTAYATDNLLASTTLVPNQAPINSTAPYGGLSTPYSVTEAYTFKFGEGFNRVNATIIETASVPEPVSITLLGAGLAGLGMVRIRRKS